MAFIRLTSANVASDMEVAETATLQMAALDRRRRTTIHTASSASVFQNGAPAEAEAATRPDRLAIFLAARHVVVIIAS